MASAFPTSAITPLLERNILECLPVIHKRLHRCLVIPFRPHLEPVRWTLPSLHFRKTWFREGERLAWGHTARMQHSQDSNVCLNLQPLLPINPVTSLGTEVEGWTPDLPDQNPDFGRILCFGKSLVTLMLTEAGGVLGWTTLCLRKRIEI